MVYAYLAAPSRDLSSLTGKALHSGEQCDFRRNTSLLAGGRVLNDKGRSVYSARIAVEVWVDEHGKWASSPELASRTSPAGAFAVRGLTGATRFRVVASKYGHAASEPIICKRGETNLTLTLRRMGSMEPTYTWSLVNPKDLLVAQLRGPGTNAPLHRENWGPYRNLIPGTYELTFRLKGTNHVLLSLSSLEVPAARTCRDPRIHPIKLDGLLSVAWLTVLDPSGSPIPGVVAQHDGRLLPPGEDAAWNSSSEDPGRIAIPTPLQLPLIVSARGCRPVVIPPPLGDRTVTLEWFGTVVLRLPDAFRKDWNGLLDLSLETNEDREADHLSTFNSRFPA